MLDKIDEFLAPHLYPPRADGSDPRICPTCGTGRLHLKTARSGGAFIGCGNYPECRYTRPIAGGEDAAQVDGRVLGQEDGLDISLRTGRFGPYVQKGEGTEAEPKPPRASLPKSWPPESLTLERALQLLHLPRVVGNHPADSAPVEAAIGRFGPYVKHNSTYANLPDVEEVFTIGMNRAVEVLAQKAAGRPGRGASAVPLKELGDHPDGGAISVMPGRYGPYVKWGKFNATIPKAGDPMALTVEEAPCPDRRKSGQDAGEKGPCRSTKGRQAGSKENPPPRKPNAAAKSATKPAAKTAAKVASEACRKRKSSKRSKVNFCLLPHSSCWENRRVAGAEARSLRFAVNLGAD